MKNKRKRNINRDTPLAQHNPLRTCIACRETKEKKELLRLVATKDGRILIDTEGDKPGRGAYLCPFKECWEGATKRDKLDHSLRTRISPESRQKIVVFTSSLYSRVSRSGEAGLTK